MCLDSYSRQADGKINDVIHSLNNQLLLMNNIPVFKLNNFHYVKKLYTRYTFNKTLNKFVQSDSLKHNLQLNGFNNKMY